MLPPVNFFLLLLLIMVVIIAVFSSLIARRSSVREPSCGRCGYAVEGLQDFRCPECGCDLRRVGILVPGMVRAMRPLTVAWMSVILWTIVLPVPALALTVMVGAMVARTHSNHMTVQLIPAGSVAPAVTINVWGEGVSSNDYDHAIVSVASAGGAPVDQVWVDLFSLEYHIMGADGRWQGLEKDLDRTVLTDVIAQQTSDDLSGLDPGAEVLSVIDALAQGGSVIVRGPVYSGASTATSSTARGNRWFDIVSVCFWVALWIFVLVLIIRRGRKRQREWNAAQEEWSGGRV